MAALMLAMYAVFWLWRLVGVDPYVALPLVTAGAFVFGFVLYRLVIGRFSHGRDENILLITLGLSIVIDNAALLFFGGDTQTIDVPYAGSFVELGAAFLPLPKLISFGASLLICIILGLYMAKSDTGKAIRAVAKERQGARLVGIDVDNIFAISYGIGIACLGAAACLLMPTTTSRPPRAMPSCWSPSPSSCWAAWAASSARRSAASSSASPRRWAGCCWASSSARSASR